MFLRRLTWFWILLTAVALALIGRLLDIQVLHAAEYEDLATRLLIRPTRYLDAPRGTIRDRHGRLLVSDEPSWDISVHYAVLTGRSRRYLRAVARVLRRGGEGGEWPSLAAGTDELRHEIADMWQRLSALTGQPVSDFIERGQRVYGRVQQIRDELRERSGLDQPVREENLLHPVIQDVSDDVALAVRLEMEKRPWIRVVPSSRRVVHGADTLVHLLGRLGEVDAEHLAEDPFHDDPLRALLPGDHRGITGVEQLAETTLRGQRGRIVEELDRTVLEQADPVTGGDVTLSIDLDLQEHVYGLLAATIENTEPDEKLVWPAGGSAVVLDVATREVLALVSYPVYAREQTRESYAALRRDARRMPLRFRAVSSIYPPGSTCKAITLVGALTEGETTPEERVHCTGHLLPERTDIFRCWIYNQYQLSHDMTENPAGQNGEDAIRNSCNIYFFTMGGRLGPERLCDWFTRFGLGRTQGTGLIEESPGIVPTAAWLEATQGREPQRSDAWNWAIGQGEISATPLQVANVCASVAAGYWEPVHLIRGEQSAASERVRFDAGAMRVLRSGMWRVVNDERGSGWRPTAWRAQLERNDYVLCGKTGSAQAVPQPVLYRYTFEWPDGRRETVNAYLEEDALAHFGDEKPRRVGKHTIERFPDLLPGELSAHAWFMGYTQPADTPRGDAPHGHVYAIAVIVEYGLSGGHVAAPIAKQIAEYLLDHEP
ncbi:MAG: penicillin-binding transpeptidase domain-containing protein [Phycisphaerae bacterium]|jgi:cell division protein FtsI/penicillin-binding protein 2